MRWRVSLDVAAGSQTFHRHATSAAASLEDLLDDGLPAFDSLADELESEIDVAAVTRLQITCEQVR